MGLFKKIFSGEEEVEQWESIDDTSDRLKVPNGWIVRSWIKIFERMNNLAGASIHQVFIEDPSHSWKLEKIREKNGG